MRPTEWTFYLEMDICSSEFSRGFTNTNRRTLSALLSSGSEPVRRRAAARRHHAVPREARRRLPDRRAVRLPRLRAASPRSQGHQEVRKRHTSALLDLTVPVSLQRIRTLVSESVSELFAQLGQAMLWSGRTTNGRVYNDAARRFFFCKFE